MQLKVIATSIPIFITPKKSPKNPEQDTIESLIGSFTQTKISPYYQEYMNSYGGFSTDIPKYLLNSPSDKTIFTKSLAGDSEGELSASDTEANGAPKHAKFRLESAIKPKEVTILGTDGRIKGDQLISLTHRLIQATISTVQGASSFEPKKEGSHRIKKGSHWLKATGHWVQFQADSEIKKEFQFDKASVGLSKLEVRMEYLPTRTERIHLSDEKFLRKLWGDVPSKTDYSCKEIFTITDSLRGFAILDDKALATIQLDRLKGIDTNSQTDTRIGPWIDYVNVWLFGVEASRINTTFVTGVMVLELIQAGKMSYKEALSDNPEFGGQLPPATLKSGSNNFKARRRLLEHAEVKPIGLSEDRQNPQWLAITLKEALVIKNWLKLKRIISRDFPIEIQRNQIAHAIEGLIQNTYLNF